MTTEAAVAFLELFPIAEVGGMQSLAGRPVLGSLTHALRLLQREYVAKVFVVLEKTSINLIQHSCIQKSA